MSKTVWSILTGEPVVADESPLEPGVYHIPAGSVEIEPPQFNSSTHNCVYNFITEEWDVTLKPIISETPDPIVYEEPEDLIEEMRQIRNGLLKSSDYRLLPDYTGSDVEAWKTYRQELRDFPSTNPNPTWNQETGELENLNWPTEPGA